MRRVFVTGGSRGLGLEICRRLLQGEWEVVTASRTVSPELTALITTYPGRIEHHVADFAAPDSTERLTEKARLLDGFDGFVANAGVGSEGLLTLTSEQEILRIIQVNLLSPLLLARSVVKGMFARGGGSLVFISSVAARTGFSGLASYSAAKGGLTAFSRSLAREYGGRGIRSNAVLPGFLETEMTAALSEVERERIARRTALKRLGHPQDVAGCVLFLLSDEARYVTGGEFVVDGGMTA